MILYICGHRSRIYSVGGAQFQDATGCREPNEYMNENEN